MKGVTLPTETVFVMEMSPIKFGLGAMDEIGFDARRLGLRKVLIVTDPGLAALGLPERVRALLDEQGIKADVFDGVEVELLLPIGIYACRLDERPAVASLGRNPTFVDDGPPVLEVHVLDWDGDLYGRRVRVTFVERLRDEAKFDSVDALIAQIQRDCENARAALGVSR